MNASLVVFLLFLSICEGKEHDRSPPADVLPTTKWQKKVETLSEGSCPDPTDIEPCVCITEAYYRTSMNCSNVQDEEQLRKVFSASFPTAEFYEFQMWNNTGVKVLEDGVFGNINFVHLNIQDSVLETVKISALTPSLSTLRYITIQSCMLEIFPFERLSEFTVLSQLILSANNIHTIPLFANFNLQKLHLDYNTLKHLKPQVFTSMDNIMEILLNNNHLTEILEGTFASSYQLTLDLHNNTIDYIEVDAFKGVEGNAIIDMSNNALTRFPEEVWRPELTKGGIAVNLTGNALTCGCDVAWLVRDSSLLKKVIDGRCADGTPLIDLLSADFEICD